MNDINYFDREKNSNTMTTTASCLPYIYGWNNIDEVANDVWSGIHRCLLEGDLVFAYKAMEGELRQIVVVKNKGTNNEVTYGVGYFTTGYSALFPKLPIDYLRTVLLEDLRKFKVNKKIIETYEQIVSH